MFFCFRVCTLDDRHRAQGAGALFRQVQPRVSVAAVPPAAGKASAGRQGRVEARASSDATAQGNPRRPGRAAIGTPRCRNHCRKCWVFGSCFVDQAVTGPLLLFAGLSNGDSGCRDQRFPSRCGLRLVVCMCSNEALSESRCTCLPSLARRGSP